MSTGSRSTRRRVTARSVIVLARCDICYVVDRSCGASVESTGVGTLEPNSNDERHLPGPSLWPIGFAIGVVGILVGLIVSWPAVAVGAAIAVFCGFMWVRDAGSGYRDVIVHEPERRAAPPRGPAPPATDGRDAMPVMSDEEIERFPRSRFLEASTLGLGALIGGIVTVPVLGFMVVPAFVDQDEKDINLGPL